MWNITNVQEGTEEWMDLENRIRTYIRSMDITDPSVFGHTFPRHVWITDSGVIHYLLHGKEEENHTYHTHGRFRGTMRRSVRRTKSSKRMNRS